MASNISPRKCFTTELNSKNFFALKIIQDAPRLTGFSLPPSGLEAAGEKREKMHTNGEAYAKGVTGRMPWRDLLRRTGANSIDGARSGLARSRGKTRRSSAAAPGLKCCGGQTAEGVP